MAWYSTNYPGVRYRENPKRRHNGKADRYYVIRYQTADKVQKDEPVGWASEDDLNPTKVNKIRAELIHNIRMGLHPQSLTEKREMDQTEQQRIAEEKAQIELETKRIESQNITFGEVAEQFLAWSKDNRRSHKDDLNRYNQVLKDRLANLRIKDITTRFIDETLKPSWLKRVAPHTVTHYLSLLHSIFQYGITRMDLEFLNPVTAVKRLKYDNEKTRFYSREQAEQLLNYLNKPEYMNVHDQVVIGIYAGLRFSEIVSIKWADVDLDNGIIEIRGRAGENGNRTTKTGRSRYAYIVDPVREVIERRMNDPKRHNVYLFIGRNGEPVKHISKTFFQAVQDLKFNDGVTDRLDKLDFHATRRTFASWLAQDGISLYEIKDLLGHRRIGQTERYAKLLPDTKRRAVESLVRPTKAEQTDNNLKLVKVA